MVSYPLPFEEWLPTIRGKLIVSCQALEGEPLHGAEMMARLAVCAEQGGAAAIRANTPEDIRAIRAAVQLPILGLYKVYSPGFEVYITPTLESARQVAQAGADVICVDGTNRPRPAGLSLSEFIQRIRDETGCPVLADISTLEEALRAEDSGANLVSSALSGYTSYSPQIEEPDLGLVAAMVKRLTVPVLAEGRYIYPSQVSRAVCLGAFAVVVGGAITRPVEITERFVAALEKCR